MTEPLTSPPTRWGAHMQVQHRITGDIGEVVSVHFDEQIVIVEWADPGGTVGEVPWRIENVYEAVQS